MPPKKASSNTKPTKAKANPVTTKVKVVAADKRPTGVAKEAKADEGGVAIPWATELVLTYNLLTYIEDNETTRTALKFSKGDTKGRSDGLKMIEHYTRIADFVLVKDKSGTWKDFDPKELAAKIKNRLERLKKQTAEWDRRMSQTGQGVTEVDRANLIETRTAEFPFYERMKALLHQSPVVDRSTVVNSSDTAPVDLFNGSTEEDADDVPVTSIDDDNGGTEVVGTTEKVSAVEKDPGKSNKGTLKSTAASKRKRSLTPSANGSDDEETSSDETVALNPPASKKRTLATQGRQHAFYTGMMDMYSGILVTKHQHQAKLEEQRLTAERRLRLQEKKLELEAAEKKAEADRQLMREGWAHEEKMVMLKTGPSQGIGSSGSAHNLALGTKSPGQTYPNLFDL